MMVEQVASNGIFRAFSLKKLPAVAKNHDNEIGQSEPKQ